MTYFNELDSFAAEWLGNLYPDAEIDCRDIHSVRGSDLEGHRRVHLFAGIGGWEYALKLARWPERKAVWTGSCPCQPFSDAGRRKGNSDPRHLWPEFLRLVKECSPSTIFGEQVGSKAGREWLSGVFADLEALGYAVAGADLCAAGVGAPHIRQRLFWVAIAERSSDFRTDRMEPISGWWERPTGPNDLAVPSRVVGVDHPRSQGRNRGSLTRVVGEAWNPQPVGSSGRVGQPANPTSERSIPPAGSLEAIQKGSTDEKQRVSRQYTEGSRGRGGLDWLADSTSRRESPTQQSRQLQSVEPSSPSRRVADGVGQPVRNARPGAIAQAKGRLQRAHEEWQRIRPDPWQCTDLIRCSDGAVRRVPSADPESGLQRVVDGISPNMGTISPILKATITEVVRIASENSASPGQVLSALRCASDEKALQRRARMPGDLPKTEVLLATLRELAGELGYFVDGPAQRVNQTPKGSLRAVRRQTSEPETPPRSPQRREYPQQSNGESRDAMYTLSSTLQTLESAGGFPLISNMPNRVNRLRAYGNGIVPQLAAQFIRAVMDAT